MPKTTVDLARYLVGAILVSDVGIEAGDERTAVRIVETEAYDPDDAASHAFRGETARNGAMFLRRGHAYVYFIYGTSFCFNVSSETAGIGAAVLVRAGEPIAGLATMRARRPGAIERDLCRGPGRLARSLGLTRAHDRIDLCASGPLRLAPREATREAPVIVATPRIGVTREVARPLRFVEAGNPFASGRRAPVDRIAEY